MPNANRDRLRNRAKKADQQFEEKYIKEINALAALSPEQLKGLIPEGTDPETFNQLMAVVKNASTANHDRAQLKGNIQSLGQKAMSLTKLMPSPLSGLFA